jgi:hypothetical protein
VPEQYDLAPEDPKPQPKAKIDAPSLLSQPAADACPKCGTPMGPADVLCVSCGHDLRANTTRDTERGEVLEEPAKLQPEFVTPGLAGAQTLLVVGAVLTVATLVAAIYNTPKSAGINAAVAAAVLVVLNTLIHTATGLLAVTATAWLTEHRFGRVDLAAARVYVAFAAFLLVTHIALPMHPSLSLATRWLAGMLTYWLVVMVLFRKGPQPAAMLGLIHLGLYILLMGAVALQGTLNAALAAAPAAAPAATP